MRELTEMSLVQTMKDACDGRVVIYHGWAKNIPGKPAASKLACITFLGESNPHAVFWIWRENSAPEWTLVEPWHWAPLAAATNWKWSFLAVEPDLIDNFLSILGELLERQER